MAISRASGFPVDDFNSNVSTNPTAITVSPLTLGDVFVVSFKFQLATPTITGLSGGGVTTWNKAVDLSDSTNGKFLALWWGVVTATGSQTMNVSWSSTPSVTNLRVLTDELTATGQGTWTQVTQGTTQGTTGTTIPYASLTSNGQSTQAYYGYGRAANASSAGSTTGFTYTGFNTGNEIALNPALAANTVYSPTFTESVSGNYDTVAAILAYVPPVTPLGNATAWHAVRTAMYP